MKRLSIIFGGSLGLAGGLLAAWIVGTNMLLASGVRSLKSRADRDAFRELRMAAWLGDSTAEELVGRMYAFGWGTAKDDEEAIRCFSRARVWPGDGAAPEAVSEYYVAESFAKGVEVAKSDGEAMKWFRRSAERGYKRAQALLADAYEHGLYGVAPDVAEARRWRSLAIHAESPK